MIEITPTLSIREDEIEQAFIRASGPGGQNVNKTSTAVQIRFDARRSPSLPNDVAIRLMKIAGSRLTKDGVIVITAQSRRTQADNRAEALERLVAMVAQAAEKPKKRVATRVSAGQKARRVDAKTKRGATKALRKNLVRD